MRQDKGRERETSSEEREICFATEELYGAVEPNFFCFFVLLAEEAQMPVRFGK